MPSISSLDEADTGPPLTMLPEFQTEKLRFQEARSHPFTWGCRNTFPHVRSRPTKFFYDILCRLKVHTYTYVPHLVIPATRSHRHLVDWQPFSLAPLALVRHQLLLCSDMRKSPVGSLQWYKDMTCFQKPPYSGSLHCLCLRYGYIASITAVFLVIPLGAGHTR